LNQSSIIYMYYIYARNPLIDLLAHA